MVRCGIADGGVLEQVEGAWSRVGEGECRHGEGGLVEVVLSDAWVCDVNSDATFSSVGTTGLISQTRS